MFKRQKQILLRSVTLAICLIGMIIYLVFDGFFSYDYSFTKGANPLYWLSFWTHLSNLGAFVWVAAAWIAVVFKKERLEEIISGEFTKNLVFTFIIVTGIVYMTVAYIPVLMKFTRADLTIGDLIDDPTNTILLSNAYKATVIIGTTFKHLLIPGMFIIMAALDPEYSGDGTKVGMYRKSFILLIFPTLYFLWVILLTTNGVPAPYPVVNFANHLNHDGEEIKWFTYLFYIFCDILVAALFVTTSSVMTWLAERSIAKNEPTIEIVEGLLKK